MASLYPGNKALARDTQDRITSTFRQAVTLARQGRMQEAILGCDFILKMDPDFEPARELASRVDGAPGAIDASDLLFDEPGPALPEIPEFSGPIDSGAAKSVDFTQPIAASGRAGEFDDGWMDTDRSPAKIQELLDEGQDAFDRGAFQAAIDAWSRVFLIDIDHEEANSRIEEARRLRAEEERRIEEQYHRSLDLISAGKTAEARTLLEELLEICPQHLGAREQLEALDRPSERSLYESLPPAPAGSATMQTKELPAPATAGTWEAPASRPSASVSVPLVVAKRSSSRLLWIGALAAAVILLVAWSLFRNWSRWFPNTEVPVAVGLPSQSLRDANRLYLDGKRDEAIALLESLPRSHPAFARGQELVERWRAEAAAEAAAAAPPPAVGPVVDRERDEFLVSARSAFRDNEYLRSARLFQAAARRGELDAADEDEMQQALRRLVSLREELRLFRDREWDRVAASLWRALQDSPNDHDARELLCDTYFNLGLRELKRAAPANATQHFAEAMALRGDSPELDRLHQFSETYSSRSRDLLYDIFVGQLEYR